MVEDARVGGGRGTGRGADRFLVHEDHAVDAVEPLDRVVLPRLFAGRVEPPGHRTPEHLEHERCLPRAARAGHRREHAQWNPHVHAPERAVPHAAHLDPSRRLASTVLALRREHRVAGATVGEDRPRHARPDGRQLRRRRVGHDRAPLATAAGPEVERMVGGCDDVPVVFHHDDRVAEVAELAERRDETVRVARMQADRRLVEYVEHAGEAAAHLRRQADPLHLAPREAPRGPGHVEVVEADVHEKLDAGGELAQEVTGDPGLLG